MTGLDPSRSFDRATRNSSRDNGVYRHLFRRFARAWRRADIPRDKPYNAIADSNIGDSAMAKMAKRKSPA